MLTRENIKSGYIRELIRRADPDTRLLTDEELRASVRTILTPEMAGRDVWLFGYGSLIWNPAFHFVERRLGTLHGYHRRFCLWTHLGRGTPDCPGLVLGLERGGSCRGVLVRVAAEAAADELEIVWRREMVSGAYAPRWVTGRTAGGPVRAAPIFEGARLQILNSIAQTTRSTLRSPKTDLGLGIMPTTDLQRQRIELK